MASEWFYRTIGVQQVGPISSDELRNLAQRGMLSHDTLVKNSPEGPWVPADRVKGLFSPVTGVGDQTPNSASLHEKKTASADAPQGS